MSKRVMPSNNVGGRQKKKKKKLVIRSFARKPKVPEDFEMRTWTHLRDAVRAIFRPKDVLDRSKIKSYQELYSGVENLCIHKMSKRLHKRLENELNDLIQKEVSAVPENATSLDSFLKSVDQTWRHYDRSMSLIRSIFMYFDRSCMANDMTSRARSVLDIGLLHLRSHLDSFPGIVERSARGVLDLIRKERDGNVVDRSQIKSILDMFWDVRLYSGSSFESQLLEESSRYYEREVETVLKDFDLSHILRHVDKRLKEESIRVLNYLNPCSESRLLSTVERHYLERNSSVMIEKGFSDLMIKCAHQDLRLMYDLFDRVDALSQLKDAFKSHIEREGSKLVTDGNVENMISSLLELKDRIDETVRVSFRDSRMFQVAREEAFVIVMNCRQKRPPELLAKFMHNKLRSNNKISPGDVEKILERALVLFRYLNSKDVFGAFYKEDLAKRLLTSQSTSNDLERFVIQHFKIECGSMYTNNMEGMFKDMDISKEISETFEKYRSARAAKLSASSSTSSSFKQPTTFVRLLTTGFWPTYVRLITLLFVSLSFFTLTHSLTRTHTHRYTPLKIVLPTQIKTQERMFADLYCQKYSGRRVAWQHGLGSAVLRAQFPRGRKELHVSIAQATVLMIFNTQDNISFDSIQSMVGMQREDLHRVLKSLCSPKVRVLRVSKQKVFSFNTSFSLKLFRIKLASWMGSKEVKERRDATNEKVWESRQYQIDACLVRVVSISLSLFLYMFPFSSDQLQPSHTH